MRLLTFPNVLITAHQAFLTEEALAEIARVTAANLVNRRLIQTTSMIGSSSAIDVVSLSNSLTSSNPKTWLIPVISVTRIEALQ